VTASLPADVQAVFERFITCELTTIDSLGQPVTSAVKTAYSPGAPCIDVTATEVPSNPLVALLFSDPTGSGLEDPPMVLVQGSAQVADAPPIRVRPERIYVWPQGEVASEPELYDAHMEEVRSGHSEEPDRFHASPEGGASAWHPRIAELEPTAVLSLVSPDGFPFAVRVPVEPDEAAGLIRVGGAPMAVPFQPGLGCLTTRSVRLLGDLVAAEDGWALVPHGVVEDAGAGY
jgi:hypothetical protein